MKTVLSIACGVALLLGGMNADAFESFFSATNTHTKVVLPHDGEDDPVWMHGHVKNTSGGAIAYADVTLTLSGTTTAAYSTQTDSSGYYSFATVAQGLYRLDISAHNYVTKQVNVTLTSDVGRVDTLIAQ